MPDEIKPSDKDKKKSGASPLKMDITYQILPGRFVVKKDSKVIDEIKLYRTSPQPLFTIGREQGPTMRHVQLDDASVSVNQATLSFEKGRFVLLNQSKTSPTIVDGTRLKMNESKKIKDGSKIVMGEITLQFAANLLNKKATKSWIFIWLLIAGLIAAGYFFLTLSIKN